MSKKMVSLDPKLASSLTSRDHHLNMAQTHNAGPGVQLVTNAVLLRRRTLHLAPSIRAFPAARMGYRLFSLNSPVCAIDVSIVPSLSAVVMPVGPV